MPSEDPGPGQMNAIQARKHITTLRKARPDIVIGIRWRPTQRGVPGNEKADEWARLAAEETGACEVGWMRFSDRCSRRQMPYPGPLHASREISEAKALGGGPDDWQEVAADQVVAGWDSNG